MKLETAPNPDSDGAYSTPSEKITPLVEAARQALLALPVKHRISIFKKAAVGSPATLTKILLAAHIPSSFQSARIAHWLNPAQHLKMEELVLLPEYETWFASLLRGFFCAGHKSLNDLFLQVLAPGNERAKNFEDALNIVQREHPTDPFLPLFLATTRWICQDSLKDLAELHADCGSDLSAEQVDDHGQSKAIPVGDNFAELDKHLHVVSEAVTKLGAIQPVEVGEAIIALQRAQTLITSVANELRTLAAEVDVPDPKWSTREEFVTLRQQVAGLASGREKMNQRAAALVEDLAKLFSGVNVRHRLPNRSVALTAIARSVVGEISGHTEPLKAVVMSQTGTALDWLKWLWQQEGDAAENIQQKLSPISPAFAELLANADWRDLQWPETDTSGAPLPPVKSPTTEMPEVKKTTAAATVSSIPDHMGSSQNEIAKPEPVAVSLHAAPVQAEVLEPNPKIETEDPSLKPAPGDDQQFAVKPQIVKIEPDELLAPAETPAIREKGAEGESTGDASAAAVTPSVWDKSGIVSATWRLASSHRWGLASHLADFEASAALPPSWVFQAAALAPRLNYEVSPISERLTEVFARSADFRPESVHPDVLMATRILLAAVALRPTLLAPTTNAASILKLTELKSIPNLQSLGHLVEAVAEFGLHRQALQPEMLLSSHNLEDWQQQLDRVRAEINVWIEEAPSRGFNYALAARIWRKWTANNGSLRQLLKETIATDTKNFIPVKAKWEPWSSDAAELVQSGIREFNQRKSMDGTARDKLIAQIGEAVQLADRVFALLAQTPQPAKSFRTEQVHQLLAARQRYLAPARQELNKILSATQDQSMAAAVRLCAGTLDQVEDLLQGRLPLPGRDEPDPHWILDAELLRNPAFQVGPDGTLPHPDRSNPDPFLALAQTGPDWKDAWACQIKSENHHGTASLLDFFRWEHPPGLDLAELENQRTVELKACRHRLEKECAETQRLLDEFVSLGLCREQDYNTWTAEVRNVEQVIETAMNFAPLSGRLNRLRLNVRQQRDDEVRRVRQRLAETESAQPSDRNRITTLLDSGDIHTAIDYLDLAVKKLPLPQSGTRPSIFIEFFGMDGWLRKAEATFREANFNECWQAARDGKMWNGLNFQFLGTDQRTNVVAQLQHWQTLERSRLAKENEANKLASFLGLEPIKITARPSRSGTHLVQPFDIKAQVIVDRSKAIVPAFGSDANGRYTLHLVWGEPDAEELLSLCTRETGDTSAQIIVTFRLLTTKDRYELAEEARKSERSFKGVVVDRALFAFICAQPTGRFPSFLRCALPFSCVEPYSVTAGDVPPEMFFGRGRELASLADLRGSCFVFGGRQLGKTALLRELERRFTNLEQDRAAVFVDLKRELFSRGRGINALWSVLVSRLKEEGVLNENKVGASAGQEALFRHIEDWLNVNPNRRLLLLLDEADMFLEEDGRETEHYKSFPRCQLLKGLMDDTGRRFKVVLAGLHNVQRTTRSVNHPLAHFGEAICIGPMLEEAESREARALVEQPLAAAGYVFESPDVVSRILALTNYYPSLIQIFCHHLLLDLRANHVMRFSNPRSTPPCMITSQHVQTAYGSRVREAIHIKVGLTLDLDKRYKLIARLLAFYHANQLDNDGVALRDIRSDVAEYWPAGFSDLRADDEFRSLLEEMVGLGILRQIPNTSRFALRNQNVTTLLGNPEEIARQLHEAKNWEPAQKYEADKFRRLLGERPKLIFSPLTVQQESELKAPENRVVILYGLPAAGLAYVSTAMASDSLFGKSRTKTVHDCSDAICLDDRIARLDRAPQSNSIIIVPPELTWDETWVAAAHARISTFTSKDSFLTVLFIADSHRTAATIQGLEGVREQGIRELTLHPWDDAAVRQWLEDQGVVAEIGTRALIRQATGNWPELLMRLNGYSKGDLPQACADLEQLVKQPGQLPELHSAFGFGDMGADQPLRIAAQLKQFTVEDVCDYSDAGDADSRQRIADCIARAEHLGLITTAGNKLEFDPVAATVLLKATSPT